MNEISNSASDFQIGDIREFNETMSSVNLYTLFLVTSIDMPTFTYLTINSHYKESFTGSIANINAVLATRSTLLHRTTCTTKKELQEQFPELCI